MKHPKSAGIVEIAGLSCRRTCKAVQDTAGLWNEREVIFSQFGGVVQLVRTLPCRWLEFHTVTAHPNQRLFARWCLYKGLDACSLQTCAGTNARASGETKRECALTNFSAPEAASPLVCRCKPSSVLPMVRRWRDAEALHLVEERGAL